MKRGVIYLLLVLGLLLSMVPAALAADSAEVAAVVAETGVFVEPGTTVSEGRVSEIVAALRDDGENISIVVLADEPTGGATTFADAVVNQLGQGVVLVLAAESAGAAGFPERYGEAQIDSAVDASLDGQTDEEAVELFAESLLGAGVPADEPAASSSSSGSSGGGGGGLLVFLLLAGGALVAFLWWRSRQNKIKGPKLHPKLAEAKEAVQEQINDVANDLIDMEGEVRVADNERVDEFYDGAGATYNEVTEKFPTANTPEAILELSNDLDEAIWQLDSAEAILDGKPLPDRPVPKTLPKPEPPQAPPPQPEPDGGSSLPPRPQYDRPSYDRRSTRRSSPAGPGLMEILMGMAGAMMASRGRRGTPSRSAGGRSSRGGGGILRPGGGLGGLGTTSGSRRVPPPQFPTVPSPRSSGSGPTASRTSGGRRRIRTGGKRRRR